MKKIVFLILILIGLFTIFYTIIINNIKIINVINNDNCGLVTIRIMGTNYDYFYE